MIDQLPATLSKPDQLNPAVIQHEVILQKYSPGDGKMNVDGGDRGRRNGHGDRETLEKPSDGTNSEKEGRERERRSIGREKNSEVTGDEARGKDEIAKRTRSDDSTTSGGGGRDRVRRPPAAENLIDSSAGS